MALKCLKAIKKHVKERLKLNKIKINKDQTCSFISCNSGYIVHGFKRSKDDEKALIVENSQLYNNVSEAANERCGGIDIAFVY